jgi:flagellar motor switch protein FliN/FliY
MSSTASNQAGGVATARRPAAPDPRRLLGIKVPLSVVVAERAMPINSILDMTVATIIEFEKPFDQHLLLYINDKCIGQGQAVKMGENFGMRITSIDSRADRILAMGPRNS